LPHVSVACDACESAEADDSVHIHLYFFSITSSILLVGNPNLALCLALPLVEPIVADMMAEVFGEVRVYVLLSNYFFM